MGKHYIGEIGTQILLDCGINLSDIITPRIYYKKPSGIVGTWVGVLYSSYSDLALAIGTYFVSYTLAGTDANVSGEWEFQAVVANTAGTWYGETAKMSIYGTFE